MPLEGAGFRLGIYVFEDAEVLDFTAEDAQARKGIVLPEVERVAAEVEAEPTDRLGEAHREQLLRRQVATLHA